MASQSAACLRTPPTFCLSPCLFVCPQPQVAASYLKVLGELRGDARIDAIAGLLSDFPQLSYAQFEEARAARTRTREEGEFLEWCAASASAAADASHSAGASDGGDNDLVFGGARGSGGGGEESDGAAAAVASPRSSGSSSQDPARLYEKEWVAWRKVSRAGRFLAPFWRRSFARVAELA